MNTPSAISVESFPWPEVAKGDDIADLVAHNTALADGDVVVLTSKVVAKAEGLLTTDDRADVVARSTRRIVARRGQTVIAETHHGFVLAAAGVDGSNVAEGQSLPLPADPDATSREVREALFERVGVNVAVVITDTAGRVWRNGQTDHAIGAAGLDALVDLSGREDAHGNTLLVTAPALADEIASAADLVKGKTSGRPCAVVRGLAASVLPAGEHGIGVAALIREGSADLFGLGAREAVIAAATRDADDLRHFASLVPDDRSPFIGLLSARPDVRVALRATSVDDQPAWTVDVSVAPAHASAATLIEVGRVLERADVLAAGHRLREVSRSESEPHPFGHGGDTEWQQVAEVLWVVA